MFPILDARGKVIGFGGRVLGEGEPKYLNSPETPLFEKGRELYGLLPGARRDPRRRPRAGGRRLHGRGRAGAARRRLRGGDARHRDHAGARAEAAAPDRRAGVLLRRRRGGPQGRLARARNAACRARRRQAIARSCSCPRATIRTATSASTARRRSRSWCASADPLSEFLLAELRAQRRPRPPPRAAPSCWTRPSRCLEQIAAPASAPAAAQGTGANWRGVSPEEVDAVVRAGRSAPASVPAAGRRRQRATPVTPLAEQLLRVLASESRLRANDLGRATCPARRAGIAAVAGTGGRLRAAESSRRHADRGDAASPAMPLSTRMSLGQTLTVAADDETGAGGSRGACSTSSNTTR